MSESQQPITTPPSVKLSMFRGRNYLVAKYKDRPLEFWDAKNLTFMRELVSNPPTFSCVVSSYTFLTYTHTFLA